MGSKSDSLEVDILKAVTGQATSILTTTPLTHVYCALYTANPTDSTSGTEVSTSGTAYARVDTVTKWATPSAGSVATNADLAWSTATADWGTVTGFALITTSSGAGTILYWGALTGSKVVSSGDTFSFPSGQLTLTED